MELKEESTKKEKKTSNIRRPLGVCIIPFTQIQSGIADTERNFKVYRIPADDDSMDSFTRNVAIQETKGREHHGVPNQQPIKSLGELWVQLKVLFGNQTEVNESHPNLVGKEG
jgi:hypothetical protein